MPEFHPYVFGKTLDRDYGPLVMSAGSAWTRQWAEYWLRQILSDVFTPSDLSGKLVLLRNENAVLVGVHADNASVFGPSFPFGRDRAGRWNDVFVGFANDESLIPTYGWMQAFIASGYKGIHELGERIVRAETEALIPVGDAAVFGEAEVETVPPTQKRWRHELFATAEDSETLWNGMVRMPPTELRVAVDLHSLRCIEEGWIDAGTARRGEAEILDAVDCRDRALRRAVEDKPGGGQAGSVGGGWLGHLFGKLRSGLD